MSRANVLSLPNILTYGRILAVPALVACFYGAGDAYRWLALGIFAAAAITDFLDGWLARVWEQQSDLGRMLDPIADKLLVATALIMLAASGTVADWSLLAAVVILSREIMVSGLREYLAEMQVRVPVSQLAKWKTTVQLFSLGFLLAGPAGDKVLPHNTTIGLVLLWIAAALTLYTGFDYVRHGIAHILENDK